MTYNNLWNITLVIKKRTQEVLKLVFDKVKSIIIEHLGLDDEDKLTLEASLMKDLEADSLDAVEIIMAIEDEFDIEVSDEDAEAFENIGDIVKYIEEKVN